MDLFTLSEPVQLLSLLFSELGITKTNRITLLALLAAASGQDQFETTFLTLATYIGVRKKNRVDAVNRALNRIAKQQKALGIALVEWQPGGQLGGKLRSQFRLPFIELANQAYTEARKVVNKSSDPQHAMMVSVREFAQSLLKKKVKKKVKSVKKTKNPINKPKSRSKKPTAKSAKQTKSTKKR